MKKWFENNNHGPKRPKLTEKSLKGTLEVRKIFCLIFSPISVLCTDLTPLGGSKVPKLKILKTLLLNKIVFVLEWGRTSFRLGISFFTEC